MNVLIFIGGLILFAFSGWATHQIIKDRKEDTNNGMYPLGRSIPLMIIGLMVAVVYLIKIIKSN